MDVRGAAETVWWATRESGQRPACEDSMRCSSCGGAGAGDVARKAYAVLKVCGAGVVSRGLRTGLAFFAPLNARSLWTLGKAAHLVCERGRRACVAGCSTAVGDVSRALVRGIGCGGAGCDCRFGYSGKCPTCIQLQRRGVETRFWLRRFFCGAHGGDGCPFEVVSDAVGDVALASEGKRVQRWLSCPGSRCLSKVRSRRPLHLATVEGSLWKRGEEDVVCSPSA